MSLNFGGLFRAPATSITSYPYEDIADGTGIVDYSGCRVGIDATAANDEYILTTNNVVPNITKTAANLDEDFDVIFTAPKIIQGDATIVLPISASSGGAAITGTPQITIIHYDGSTETVISAQTTFQNATAAGAAEYHDITCKMTIPRTHFKKGEILRINVVVTKAGTSPVVELWHNPAGTTSNFTDSGGNMKVYIPFILDLS